MNETTKRFPRTLGEAFPWDSRARAEYGCAIKRCGGDSVRARALRDWLGFVAAVFCSGLLIGLIVR